MLHALQPAPFRLPEHFTLIPRSPNAKSDHEDLLFGLLAEPNSIFSSFDANTNSNASANSNASTNTSPNVGGLSRTSSGPSLNLKAPEDDLVAVPLVAITPASSARKADSERGRPSRELLRQNFRSHSRSSPSRLRVDSPSSKARLRSPLTARASGPVDTNDCVVCGHRSSKPENRCRSVWYCSRQCQETDWPSHKLLCKSYICQSPRPSPLHRRAIVFPQSANRPVLRWILCERTEDDMRVTFEHPHSSTYLGDDDPHTESVLVEKSMQRGRALAHPIEVIFRETCLLDGSKPNRSIAASLGGTEATKYQWNGPVVVFRRKGSKLSERLYEDITLADFHFALEYFRSCGQ